MYGLQSGRNGLNQTTVCVCFKCQQYKYILRENLATMGRKIKTAPSLLADIIIHLANYLI